MKRKNPTTKLAYYGGEPAVKIDGPHYVWPPNATHKELDEIANQRNLDIRNPSNSGPVESLERNFLAFQDNQVTKVVAFNSGTTALLAAYVGVNIDQGDEVIVPVLTYHAAASPLFILRANPVLVDIDLDTRCIDPDKIEEAISERTKAITVVHQWGHPCDMIKIMAIAKKYNLAVIEDCSHAHGSRFHGRLCGTFGDVAVHSLQANKTIFAGEGGILTTNNQEIYERAILLGHNRDRAFKDIKSYRHRYWSTGFGLKLRMSCFNAIVANHSLKNFEKIKIQKHKCLNYFNKRLQEINFIDKPIIEPHIDMGAWYGFKPLYVKEALGITLKKLINLLRAEGVTVGRPSGKPLYMQPLYNQNHDIFLARRPLKVIPIADNYPNANRIYRDGMSFPTFYRYDTDKTIIDQYMDALFKIKSYYA